MLLRLLLDLLLLLALRVLPIVAVEELLRCIEVEVLAVVGHVKGWVGERLLRYAGLQGHLRVVQEPVLRVEAYVVEALHEGDIRADVELRLEL